MLHTLHTLQPTAATRETVQRLHYEACKQQVETFLSFMRALKQNKIPVKAGCSAFLALL